MTMTTTSKLSLATACAAALMLAMAGNVAIADGGGGGGGGGDNEVNCKEGMTYNKQKGICEQASLLPDDMLNEQGRALALAGYYENALDALTAVRKPDSMTLTYIGYSKRKMGEVDEGIGYYHKALAMDPTNVHTHEYLGEGYVAQGRMDLAKAELATLQTLCGTTCDQYKGLASAIAGEPESWGSL
jgi:tetratricopeptide (TPR) repeat protein